jgi:aconitate hydratase
MTERREIAAPLALLVAGGVTYGYCSLRGAVPTARLETLPRSLRVLFENVVRRSPESLDAVFTPAGEIRTDREIPFFPNRVLMHDTTCLPALADFAAMRDAVAALGGDPARVNPVIPVDLIIDHSVTVEHYATPDAVERNLEIDFRRNTERYRFVKWAQQSLANFRVVPPGSGILHQINLERLADVVKVEERAGAAPLAYPDTLVGTDSHTPMVNALGVLGWGVGGVEGQAAMLGEPYAMRVPEVVGVRLEGALRPGVNATDLVLQLTALLRAHGVIGRFVEFCGPGVSALSLADRAVIANMAPEYGATCSYFPIDPATMAYLRDSGRTAAHLALIEAYARAQGLWLDPADADPEFSAKLVFDLGAVEPTVAGPRYPHERKRLAEARDDFLRALPALSDQPASAGPRTMTPPGSPYSLTDGAVVLAAITSCTNTSNPALLIGAGLLARNARRRGLNRKPWVKTSLSPGSKVVAAYLAASGLQADLDALGFSVVGLGCMTCIGNSGTLEPAVVAAVEQQGLCGIGVLSGNRNFDGRVNRHLAGAYLASPALVVAYALAGSMTIDLVTEPLGTDAGGKPVMLADLWPRDEEIRDHIRRHVQPGLFADAYRDVYAGPRQWRALDAAAGTQFAWDDKSDYIRPPPYFDGITREPPGAPRVTGARPLLVLGDNITTDHISPASTIPADSLAGRYLTARGTAVRDLNQFSTRRSNHEVMLRGAFSNAKLVNELLTGDRARAGGYAFDVTGANVTTAYEAAATYREQGVPLVILAGKNYGAGSSRDWGAKAPALLGVRVVIAESFERIHRSNLIALGVIPLVFEAGQTRRDLCRDARDRFSFEGLDDLKVGRNRVGVRIQHADGTETAAVAWCDLDAGREVAYLQQGGVLPRVVRRFAAAEGLPA